MPIESWTSPEHTPDLAAHATAMIDAALVGTDLAREAYWAAVRKGYNTPYNDPPRKGAPQKGVPHKGAPDAGPQPARPDPAPITVVIDAEAPLPVAAMAAVVAAEVRAP